MSWSTHLDNLMFNPPFSSPLRLAISQSVPGRLCVAMALNLPLSHSAFIGSLSPGFGSLHIDFPLRWRLWFYRLLLFTLASVSLVYVDVQNPLLNIITRDDIPTSLVCGANPICMAMSCHKKITFVRKPPISNHSHQIRTVWFQWTSEM